MTDKYEEFKEWFKKNRYGIWNVSDFKIPLTSGTVININDVFDIFEEEQAEKEKENEIKKVLDKYIVKIGFGSIDGDDIEINGDAVDKCYKELKEKDLIK